MADADRVAISRSLRAKALLDDPEFQSAFEAVRTSIFEKIEKCPIRDSEGLMVLRLELKILASVKANIESVFNTGKVIAHRQSLLERAMKKVVHGR